MPRSKTADALGTVRNFRIITTLRSSFKMVAEISQRGFLLTFFLTFSVTAFSLRKTGARQAIHDRQRAAICAKPVRDLAIVTHVKHGEVGVFARFHAAFAVR